MQRGLSYVLGAGLGPFLLRAVAGSGGVRIAAMLASFAVGVQLARGLGVEGYGYYGLALSVVTLAAIPGEMGLPRLVTREVAAAEARNDFPSLFGILRWADSTGLRISALMVVGIIVAGIMLVATGRSVLGYSLLLGAPMIPLMTLARIRGGALQGLHHIVRGQIPANLIRPLLLSLLLFLFAGLGISLTAPTALALYSLSAAAVFLVAHLWLRQRLPETRPAEVARQGRRWLASAIPLALTDGMRALQSEMSILLVGLIAVPATVGLFRIAAVTAATAAAPMIVANHVAFPVIARLYAQQDYRRLQKTVTALAWAQLGGVLLLSLPLVILPELLLRIVFGEAFVPAATAMRIIALGQIANAAFGPNIALLNMTNHEGRVARAMAIGLAGNVVAVLALVPFWGATGAAVAIVGSLMIWNLLTWWDARRLLGIETSVLPLRPSRR